MRKPGLALLILGMGVGLVVAGPPSNWQLLSTPTIENLNGISASSTDFAIGVGNNGAIVHFVNGDNGTLVPSGTSNDLFDVYAASPDLAIATGRDTVRLWNGTTWTQIREGFPGPPGEIFTGTWITPQQDLALYGLLDPTFNFVCPVTLADPLTPRSCRTFGGPMLTACGNSDDIKVITGDGDIWHVNNALVDVNGFDPIHDEPTSLFLTAAWIPPVSCALPGPIPPLDIFAIRNGNQVWRYRDFVWAQMDMDASTAGDQGTPGNQTLSWIGGLGASHVIAVGFKPDGSGDFDGVVWTYDGTSWVEDTNLPAGTPGLTDLAATISFENEIFGSGFEGNTSNNMAVVRSASANYPGLTTELRALGDFGILLLGNVPSPLPIDLAVEKRLLTAGPVHNGDMVSYEIRIKNKGLGSTSENIRVADTYGGYSADYVSDTCNSTDASRNTFSLRELAVPALQAGGEFVCTMTFLVTGPPGTRLYNGVNAVDDSKRDFDEFNNVADVSTPIE